MTKQFWERVVLCAQNNGATAMGVMGEGRARPVGNSERKRN